MTYVSGSVADADKVIAAAEGVDAIFHVASYGMSGKELRGGAGPIRQVNIGGTANVIEACRRNRVPRLVYVSTNNVYFTGCAIEGWDETVPYPAPWQYKDEYSRTKAEAEQMVLAANGTWLPATSEAAAPDGTHPTQDTTTGLPVIASGSVQHRPSAPASTASAAGHGPHGGTMLYTCAIRPAGIWGPGEMRHQVRVLRMVRAGLLVCTFGDRRSVMDWVHVDNLIQALVLAERALRPPRRPAAPASLQGPRGGEGLAAGGSPHSGQEGLSNGEETGECPPVAAGQAYNVSDGEPINNFEHFKPFVVGLGYTWPSLNVPYRVVYYVAALMDLVWPLLLLMRLDMEPPLTRMEVDKCSITHWYAISKARKQLGYEPAVYDRQEVVEHMAAEGWAAGAAAGRGEGAGAAAGARAWRWVMAGSVIAVVAAAVYLQQQR